VHTQLSTGRRNNHSVCMYDRFRFWSHATKFLQGGWILLLLLVPGLFAQKALADGTVQISNTNLVSFKGWGIFPAPYDRQMPTYADGSLAYGDASWLPATGALSSGNVFAALRDSGVQIARVYITPTIGKRDNTLDPNQLQDLKDHLTSLQNAGITQYVVTIWSPPAYMKLPDQVRYGTYNNNHEYLAPAYANGSGYDFAHFYVAVLAKLKEAGYGQRLGKTDLAQRDQATPEKAQSQEQQLVWQYPDHRSRNQRMGRHGSALGYGFEQWICCNERGLGLR